MTAFEEEKVKTNDDGLIIGCAYYLQPQNGYAGDDKTAKFLTARADGKAWCHLFPKSGNPLQQWILGGSADEYTLRVFDGVSGSDYATKQTLAVWDGKPTHLSKDYNTWKITLKTAKNVQVIDPVTQLPVYSVQTVSNHKFLTSDPESEDGGVCVKPEMFEYTGIQSWIFVPIDLEIVGVTFDIAAGKPSSRPLAIAQQELVNNTSVAQQMKWTTTSSITTESHFEHTAGVSIELGATFTTGVPFFADAEISISVSTNYSYTWGESTEISQQWGEEFPVMVPAHSKVNAQAIIQQANMEVPYKMTLKSRLTGKLTTSSGVWKGVDAYDIQYTLTETKL